MLPRAMVLLCLLLISTPLAADSCLKQMEHLITSGRLKPASTLGERVVLDYEFSKLLKQLDMTEAFDEYTRLLDAWSRMHDGKLPRL